MPIKTWIIRKKGSSSEVTTDASSLKVGDEVVLRTFDAPYYISTNKLNYFKNPSEPGITPDCIFKLFANDPDGNPIIDTNIVIKNGMEVGLKCNSTDSFLSVMSGSDGQKFVTTGIVNNAFILYSPNLIEDANVVDNTPIQLYYNGGIVLSKSDANELSALSNNFDDNFMNKNFPFLLMSLSIFKKLGFSYKTTFNCPSTFVVMGNTVNGYVDSPLTIIRCTAPPDYLPLSDVSVCYKYITDRNIEVVFCKASNPWNSTFPFCRQVTAIKSMGNYNNGVTNSIDSESFDRCYNQTPSGVYHMVGSPIVQGGVDEYIPVGTCVQTSSITIPPWAAINKQFIERVNSGLINFIEPTTFSIGNFNTRNKQFHYNTIVSGSEPYNIQTSSNEAIWRVVQNKGRLFVNNWGQHERYEHQFTWSDTSIIDERETSNNTAWKWLSPYKGFFGDYLDSDYNNYLRNMIVKTDAYLLRSVASLQKLCSTQNSNEHYWNQYTADSNTEKNSLLCQNFRNSFCGTTNKYNFYFFPLDECQTYCKETKDGSLEREECKNTYTTFCNKYRILPDGTKDYYNYYDYPHICGCFTNEPEFSKPFCDTLANSKRILYNDVARTSARIGDPLIHTTGQCDKPCIFNPNVCKGSVYVKTNNDRSIDTKISNQSGYKEVVTLGTTSEAICSATVCVNEIFADIPGGNATFNISQECNQGSTNTSQITANALCITEKDINDGFCTISTNTENCSKIQSRATVAFFPATGIKDYPGNTAYYSIYKTIKDGMSGACGTGGDQKFAGTISKTYNISTTQGKKVLEYTTIDQPPATNDLQDIGRVLLSTNRINYTGYTVSKIPEQNKVRIEVPYSNCVLDWRSSSSGEGRCTLDSTDRRWKETLIYDRVLTQPINGGTGCSDTLNFGKVNTMGNCTLPKNCKLEYNGTGVISSDGTHTYLYNILEYNTVGGTGCNDYKSIRSASGLPGVFTETELQNKLLTTSLLPNNIVGISHPYPSCKLVANPDNSVGHTGSCYFDSVSQDGNPIYKKDLIYQYEVTTNGGVKNIGCEPSQTAMYGRRVTQECTGTCQFTGPTSVSCDTNTGTQTVQYTVKRKAELDGVSCKNIYPAYLESQGIPPTSTVKLGGGTVGSTLSVSIRNGCPVQSDCIVEKLAVRDCINGLRQTQYKIVQQPQQGGLDCLSVAKEYSGNVSIISGKVDENIVTLVENCKVEAPAAKEEISTSLKVGGVILLIVILGIIVYFGTRRTKLSSGRHR